MGTRQIPFSREIYIEQDDFMENPPSKYFRLFPGNEVRLKNAYFIKCNDVIKDAEGNVVELHCTYDPASPRGTTPDGRMVKGTLHWVSVSHALPAEVRLYEHLFTKPDPEDVGPGEDWIANVNPHSLETLTGCRVECNLAGAPAGSRFQFLRQGYFCVDPDSTAERLVFNRTVSLRDTWAKIEKGTNPN